VITCIDYFAGIGAWELAAEIVEQIYGSQIFTTYQFVEILPEAQQVLRSQYPLIPVHADIKTYTPPPNIDAYFISFPCTGTSHAGDKTGLAHPESSLWFEALRCICVGKPKFIIVEQPEGFIHRGLRACLGGLRMAGYSWEIEIISAAELGAPHRRNRVFVIGYSNDLSLQQRQGWKRWDEQIRVQIEIARQVIKTPKTQPSPVSVDDGIPDYLAGINFFAWWKHNSTPINSGVERRTPGRREAINLIGRSIVPLQAAIPLMRVKYLASLL
jgi:DNA (cytosine-5)-methyltransferase 1